MILIKPDHDQRVEIAGVDAPVRRPVDIDQSKTGFANLRTLRIYQFEAGSAIDGHAEGDEVFIVVLAGSIELIIRSENWRENQRTYTLSAATAKEGVACAAYLPPHATYKLTPQTAADVAYVRASPIGTRPPKIFFSRKTIEGANLIVLLDEPTYAERLRLRLVAIDARQREVSLSSNDVSLSPNDVSLSSNDVSHAKVEALHFIQGEPAEQIATITGIDTWLTSVDAWDTIALPPAELYSLKFVSGAWARLLVVASG